MHTPDESFVLPFSLISGQGLGTSYSSLSKLRPYLAKKPLGQASIACSVNAATGNFIVKDKDLSLPNRGDAIHLAYTYNSKDATSSWRLTAGRTIKKIEKNQQIIMTEADGHEVEYTYDTEKNCYVAKEGNNGFPFIQCNDDVLTWYHPESRHTERFNLSTHEMIHVDEAGGETHYQYDDANQLQHIALSSGIRYEIRRDKQKIDIYRVDKEETLLHTYQLDEQQRLQKSITKGRYVIDYEYDAANKLRKISQTDGSRLRVKYLQDKNKQYKVSALQIGDDKTNTHTLAYQDRQTVFSDAAHVQSTFNFDEKCLPISFAHEDDSTEYRFNQYSQIEAITHPNQSEEHFHYDESTGLLQSHIDRNNLETINSYSRSTPPLLVVVVQRDENNPVHTQQITRHVYQKNVTPALLRYTISSTGHVKEYVYNENGLVENELDYLHDLYKARSLSEVFLEDMTAWKEKISAENKVPEVAYTRYAYDKQGLVEGIRQRKDSASDDCTETQFEHDLAGHVSKKAVKYADGQFKQETYQYNDNHDQTKISTGDATPLNQTTTTTYSKKQITTVYPNQRQEIAALNSAGCIKEKSEVVQTQKRTTAYQYYAAEKMVMVTQPDGRKTFELYDKDHRLEYTISVSGIVIRYMHNESSRYQTTLQYAQPIDMASVFPSLQFNQLSKKLAGAGIREDLKKALSAVSDKTEDRQSYTFYGPDHEPALQVDAKGHVTEYRYTIFGKVAQQIEYHQAITDKELDRLLAGSQLERTPDRKIDRLHSTFHNTNGETIAEQDAAGYVTEYILDAGGRSVEKICYATENLLISDDFEQIRPKENLEEDGHYYYVYNLLSQCIAAIGPKGHVTVFEYDVDKKEKKTIQYAGPIDVQTYQRGTFPAVMPNAEKDVTTEFEYDQLRRQVTIRKSTGSIETTYYDEMNHETAHYKQDLAALDRFSGDDCRGTAKAYDAWEQEIAYANPFVASELIKATGNPALQKEIWRQYEENSTYDQTGLRTKHQDVYGNTTLFYYDKERRPVLTIDPTGAAILCTRNSFGEAIQNYQYYQRLSDSALSTLSSLKNGYISDAICKLLKKDAQDRTTQLKRDKRGQVIHQTDPEGRITTFDYNAFKECSDEYVPSGVSTPLHIQHLYDARGLEIKTVHSNEGKDIVVEKKYGHYLGKQTDLVNELGGHTRYLRDKLGNVEEIQKCIAPTQYVTVETTKHDFLSRPIKKTDAAGAVVTIEHNQKTRAAIVHHEADQSVHITERSVFGDATRVIKAADDNPAILHEESFKHAPHGEVEVHTDGLGKSHHVTFDFMGHPKEECDANQVKQQFSYNAAYQLTQSVKDTAEGGLDLKTSYTPNAFGQPETITDPRNIVTQHTFDRSGKTSTTTQDASKGGLNIIQQTIYDQAGNETDRITGDAANKDQYHEKITWDGFDRSIASIIDPDNLEIETKQVFDAANHVIKTTDALGLTHYAYYNKLKQKRFEIRAMNKRQFAGIEYQYDILDRLTSLRTYQVPVPKDSITDDLSLSDVLSLFNASPDDTVTLYFYNSKGKERFKIRLLYNEEKRQFEGHVEETQYDAADRKVKHARYATPLLQQNGVTWTTEVLEKAIAAIANPEKDQVVYTWYDSASQERLLVGQEGAVVEKRYDDNGNVVAEIHYGQALETSIDPKETLAAVLANIKKGPSQDRATYRTYDARNKLDFTVYPNGLVERRQYDENGNPTQVCRFAKRMEKVDEANLVQTLASFVSNASTDAITETTYNHADQIETTTDALGHSDHFERNALGQVTVHTDRAGRRWEKEIDRANRVTVEKSPETLLTKTYRDAADQLQYKIDTAKSIKKFAYDQANNATTLTLEKELTKKNALPDSREMQTGYDANHNVIGTRLENIVVDDPEHTSYLAHPDLSILPEKTAILETAVIYNAKNKKIAEQDENGRWSYDFYDSLERVIVEIRKEQAAVQYTWDALDNLIEERQYDIAVDRDFSLYRQTGCLDVDILKILKTSPDDRTVTKEYNRQGLEARILSGPLLYYANGSAGIAQAETKKIYNTFGDCIYEAALVSPEIWAEKFFKHDQTGNIIAEINENKYFTHYQHDVFGNTDLRIEYAERVTFQPSPSGSQPKIKVNKSEKDKFYYCKHDKLNQQLSEMIMLREHVSAISQPLAYHVEQQGEKFTLIAEQKCSFRSWAYTPTQKEASTTYEDGTKNYKLYDDRDFLAAEIKVSRTDVHGTGQVITPFTLYLLNAFGQKSVVREGVLTGELTDVPTLSALYKIEPVSESLTLFDQRGLSKLQQDAEGRLKAYTYTPAKKIARELSVISIWHKGNTHVSKQAKAGMSAYVYKGKKLGWLLKDAPNQDIAPDANDKNFVLLQHIDEKKFSYSPSDFCTALSYVREGVIEEKILTQYNTFGDMVAEGKDETWPLRKKMNTRGCTFYTNASDGVPTIYLHDLRNQETLMLQAPKDDLSKVEMADFPTLLTWDAKRLERTETIRDPAGRMIAKKLPVTFKAGGAEFSRTYHLDRWDNIRQELNAAGEIVIEREFNHQDKLIKETLPEVEVVSENGQSTRLQPVTLHHNNVRGCQVGVTDANQHTALFILDEANQCITHVLGDNTVAERRSLNSVGQTLTMIDANNQIWGYEYNKVRELISSLFPSGKKLEKTYDGKGGLSSEREPSGKETRYNSDVRGNVWEMYLPEGQCTRTVHDHQGLPELTLNADLSQLSWERDYFGVELSHTNLSKQVTVFERDFKKQLVHQYMKETSGRSTMEIETKISYPIGDKKYPLIEYTPNDPVPALTQNIFYAHSYGLLEQVDDASTKKTITYTHDSEQRRRTKTITLNGKVLHDIGTEYDVLGRESTISHVRLSPILAYDIVKAGIKYDAVSNQRVFSVILDPSDYSPEQRCPQQNLAYWFTYDPADRVKINGGKLNGTIQLVPGQGTEFEYQGGRREREKAIKPDGKNISTDLKYEDDLMTVTQSNTGMRTERCYQKQGWQVEYYKELYAPDDSYYKETALKRILNNNGWCTRDEYHQTDRDKKNEYKFTNETGYTLNNLGIVEHHHSWQERDGYAVAYDYDHEYLKLDEWVETKVTGKFMTQDNHSGTALPAQFYFDSNAVLNGKINSADETLPPLPSFNFFPSYIFNPPIPPYFMLLPHPPAPFFINSDALKIHYDTDYEGEIFNKEFYYRGELTYKGMIPSMQVNHLPALRCNYAYLYDVNGEVFGGYSSTALLTDMLENILFHQAGASYSYNHAHISPFAMRQLLYPVGKIDITDSADIRLDWEKPFTAWHDLQMYIVRHGDSLASIAHKMYGDKNGASAIAKLNGLPSLDQALKAGHQLKIPPYIGMHNKADNHRPYHTFVSLMAGSLLPNLVVPPREEDDSMLGELIKMIAVAILMIVAPQLGVFALQFLAAEGVITAAVAATMTAQAIAISVVAALGDAAIQGVAIAAHVQSEFSVIEMLEVAVSASLDLKQMDFIARVLTTATVNTTMQLAEMKAGLRDKFDARAIGMQVTAQLGSPIIGAGVGKLGLAGTNAHIANEISNTIYNAIMGRVFYKSSAENMMMNSLSAVITREMGDYVEKILTPTINTTSPLGQTQSQGQVKAQQPKRVYSHHERAEIEAVAKMKEEKSHGLSKDDRKNMPLTPLSNNVVIISKPQSVSDIMSTTSKILSTMVKGTMFGDFIDDVKDVYAVVHGTPAERHEAFKHQGEKLANAAIGLAAGGIAGKALVAARGMFAARSLGKVGIEGLLTPERQLAKALQQSKIYEQLKNIPASSPNAAQALQRKLSVLEDFQRNADKMEVLSNDSVRYYDKFRVAKTDGPTTGSRFVMEYNSRTGEMSSWNETYNSLGNVNRVHLKNINGIQMNSQHFPSTLKDQLLERSYLRSGFNP